MNEQLPPLPGHPEPHSMKWSELELAAIKEYGEQCARAALAAHEAAKPEPVAYMQSITDSGITTRRLFLASDCPDMDKQSWADFVKVAPLYAAPVAEAAKPAPGMAVQCLAAEIVEALLADEKEGGYDLIAGMYGPAFSKLVRRWAALEYAAPVAVASQWLPIESAPKDGSMLLLLERCKTEPFIGFWCASFRRWRASETHYDTDGDACVIDRVYSEGVTHWQPLPPAPKERA